MRIVETIRKQISKLFSATPVHDGGGGWRRILEPFSGAWQMNVEEKQATLQTYSTVYACLARISKDIGKLPFRLLELDRNGLWRETTNPAYSPVLRRPNHYQTAAQFREQWILSKLQNGNTYALKRRDARGVVDSLFILDPRRVQTMVADSGDVFYQLSTDTLNGIDGSSQIVVPAREMIHDREVCLFHPLVGIGPLAAAILPATKNLKINRTAAEFFGNNAQPGGILTAPAGMTDEDAKRVQEYWQANFTGSNSGKIGVIGADMKFTSFAMKSADSQLVEQLRYSDEQIAHAFGIPPFKVGIGQLPAGQKVDDINQVYYSDALQARIESMEDCLDQGLGISERMGVELNLEPLLRMDQQRQADVESTLVKNGIKAPNEARRRFGLAPLTGGDSVYLQQQNYSMEALARRDQGADPFGTGETPEKVLSPGLLELKRLTEQSRKRRVRYNHILGDWENLAA